MFIKNLYVKKYTSILDFIQKEKIIQYALCETIENNSISYGIRVKSICEGKREEEFLLDISGNKVLVESIIRYLYENSLEVTNFKDVVSDLLFKLNQMEEKTSVIEIL